MAVAKHVWTKPELTVLVRSRPEEAVLAACKVGDVRTGPSANKKNCDAVANCGHRCSEATGS